jgi:threonine dehydratase
MSDRSDISLLDLTDIVAAQQRIASVLSRTPLITAPRLSRLIGGSLALKAEMLQITGSFKPRGAFNRLLTLTAAERARGVITISAGNHGMALAYAGSLLRVRATVVVPATAPTTKIEAIQRYGGRVVLHGPSQDLLSKCQELQQAEDLVFVHPFDDPLVIAGQGTIGLELAEEMPELDLVIVPVGGGGLISGIATALKATHPKTRIVGVEPVGAAAMTQSLAQGTVAHLKRTATIADGLAAPFAGEYTLAHVQRFVDEVVVVTDEEITTALRLILEHCKLLAEPAGAAGVAAVLAQKVVVPPGAHVVCILSGGNMDTTRLKELL